MTETTHARSRRASLLGLILTLLSFAGTFALAHAGRSMATFELSWLILGALPIWFAALLVFRQHELAALEQLDLEELRREKAASGGGEAIFSADAAGMVAANRLAWMQRFLLPTFSLVTGVYLVAMGFFQWTRLPAFRATDVALPVQIELSLILLAIVTLLTFLMSRYAAGLGRVAGWGLLRSAGSYGMGVTIIGMALCVCLGAILYRNLFEWERTLAYLIPLLMMVLGAEALLNFVLDVYRPRSPGVEARAAFDSRLLGLISEPGGIAHSVVEAINYQFGFRVSQAWFYKTLRTALPLIGFGALVLWLMSSMLIVHPFERAIVETWGRQVNADAPLGPGVHFKWPVPIQRAYKFNTGELHRISVGYKTDAAPDEARMPARTVELWTDETHSGREHFKFLIAPAPSGSATPTAARPATSDEQRPETPVNVFMMEVVVHYKIDPQRLADYTRSVEEPALLLRSLVWNETVRYNAAAHGEALLGELRKSAGDTLRQRIAARCAELKLGLEIVYVDLVNVHPERTVAEAYRTVINARQEKVAEIRKAQVTETEVLARVAGDRERALVVSEAIAQLNPNEVAKNQAEDAAAAAGPPSAEQSAALEALAPLFTAAIEADWRARRAQEQVQRLSEEFELGIAGTARQIAQADAAAAASQSEREAARAALERALAPLRSTLANQRPAEVIDAWIQAANARAALRFWYGVLERELPNLEGEAAVTLAAAHANRWEAEMQAARDVTRVQMEREAYLAAPEVYRARRTLAAIAEGMRGARKYFLAFNPAGRSIKIRYEAQTTARPDLLDTPSRLP